MRIPLPRRRQTRATATLSQSRPASAEPATAGPASSASAARRRSPARPGRLVRTLLLVGLLAALTSPGRKLVRVFARWADRHADRFTEPETVTYGRLIAPLLGGLYQRAADDVAAEFKGVAKGHRPTIVDIGCGTGELAVAISRKVREGRIVGIDNSPSMLLRASRHETTDGRVRFIAGDGARLPFPDESVEFVVSTLSLHHWSNPDGVLAEIDRVLVPRGSAFIYDLRLLTLSSKEMAGVASRAGLAAGLVSQERVKGGFPNRLFVRFRFDRGD